MKSGCPVRALPLTQKPQIWNRKSSALFRSFFALPPPDLTTKGFSTPAMIHGCWPWELLRDRGPLRRLLPSFPPPTNSRRRAPCRPASLGRSRGGGHQSSSWFRGNIRFLARSNSTLCVGFLGSEDLGFSFLNYWSGGLGIVPFFFVGVFPCWSWGSNLLGFSFRDQVGSKEVLEQAHAINNSCQNVVNSSQDGNKTIPADVKNRLVSRRPALGRKRAQFSLKPISR